MRSKTLLICCQRTLKYFWLLDYGTNLRENAKGNNVQRELTIDLNESVIESKLLLLFFYHNLSKIHILAQIYSYAYGCSKFVRWIFLKERVEICTTTITFIRFATSLSVCIFVSINMYKKDVKWV